MRKYIDLSKLTNLEFDGVNHNDYPDYCDAYLSSAELNGEELTLDELEYINENNVDFVYDELMKYLL